MNPPKVPQPANLIRTFTPRQRWLLIPLLLMLAIFLLACLPDCGKPKPKASTQTRQVTRPTVQRPKMNITRVPRTDGRVEFKVKCATTDSSTEQIWLKGSIPKGASNVQISHGGENVHGAFVFWQLPVGSTGQADEVTISYTPPAGVAKVVNLFEAEDWPKGENNQPTTRAVTTEFPGSSGKGWGEWSPPAPPGATAVRKADYTLWETTMWYGTDGVTMTADLCQDGVDALQSDTAFVAVRFPVQPPSLAYTDPYTLPVSFRSDASPYLALLDERSIPATTIMTIPLEYKPQYLTFAENELPPAPGEHWLTLGVVTSPTVDCTGVPDLPDGKWEVQAQVWLDFGGVPDTGAGSVLPLYYCYEGQQPPSQASQALGVDVTSYQGWGITAVGPHYVTLWGGLSDWELAGQGGAWITPTETVSFTHKIYNWEFVPLTFTLEATSTLGVGWVIYDKDGQTVTGPFPVDAGQVPHFHIVGQVPADATAGTYNLFVTARTADASPASQQVTDLMWVGDWVEPPPRYRLYLPLVLREFP